MVELNNQLISAYLSKSTLYNILFYIYLYLKVINDCRGYDIISLYHLSLDQLPISTTIAGRVVILKYVVVFWNSLAESDLLDMLLGGTS